MKKILFSFLLAFAAQFLFAQCNSGLTVGSTVFYSDNILYWNSITSIVGPDLGSLRVVVFPPGSYAIYGEVEIPSSTVLKCDGASFAIADIGVGVKNGFVFVNAQSSGIEGGTIENLTQKPWNRGSMDQFSIKFLNSQNCWVKGVTSHNGGHKGHISLNNSSFITVTGCVIDDTEDGGDNEGGKGYGIYLNESSDNLISCNRLTNLRHHILLENNSARNIINTNKIAGTKAWNTIFTRRKFAIGCRHIDEEGINDCIGITFGQIEFHGGNTANNIVVDNELSGNINYYHEASRGKTPNGGGDLIVTNSNNVSFGSILSLSTAIDPIIAPTIFNTFGPVDLSSCGGGGNSAFIHCPTIPTPPIIELRNVTWTPCFKSASTGNIIQYGNIQGQMVGAFPFTISATFTPQNGQSISVFNPSTSGNTFTIPNTESGQYVIRLTDGLNRSITTNVTVNPCYPINGYQGLVSNTQTQGLDKSNTQMTPNLSSESVVVNNLKENKIEKVIQEFKVFPNPATDRINLLYRISESSTVSISMVNSIGQTVKVIENQVAKPAGTYQLSVERGVLPDGVYSVIFTDKGFRHISKIVLF
jgi:hypothetical protein